MITLPVWLRETGNLSCMIIYMLEPTHGNYPGDMIYQQQQKYSSTILYSPAE